MAKSPLTLDGIRRINAKSNKYTTGTFLGYYIQRLLDMVDTFRFIEPLHVQYLNELFYRNIHNLTMKEYFRYMSENMDTPPITASKRELLVIDGYIKFIELCIEHKEHCNIDALKNLCVIMHEPIIKGFVIPTNTNIKQSDFYDSVEKDKLLNVLNTFDKENDFLIQRLKNIKHSDLKGADGLQQMRKQILKDKSKLQYLNVYEITSVKDILSASLQEIFNANKCINKCPICHRIFTPVARTDTKYCNYPVSGLLSKYKNTPCKNIAVLENRRNHYKNDEIYKLYKRIRTKLYNRIEYGAAERNSDEIMEKAQTEYENFIYTYDDLREEMKTAKDISKEEGAKAEEKLLLWLKEQEITTSRKKKK